MDPIIGSNRLEKSIDIGTRELAQSSILEDQSRDIMCLSYLFEYINIDGVSCFIFFEWLDTECLEKKSLELFR
jgi:hypothetical protein